MVKLAWLAASIHRLSLAPTALLVSNIWRYKTGIALCLGIAPSTA